MLIVQECFPFIGSPTYPTTPPRAAQVQELIDALSPSWIKGLPGKKRLCFLQGQLFVIQIYMGFKVARAQVLHAQQPMDALMVKASTEGLGDSSDLIILQTPAVTQIAANT